MLIFEPVTELTKLILLPLSSNNVLLICADKVYEVKGKLLLSTGSLFTMPTAAQRPISSFTLTTYKKQFSAF
jgi:hypothetical protein